MARYFTEKITKEELEQKITHIEKTDFDDDTYYYNQLTEQVSKDLAKVQFDCENMDIHSMYGDSVQDHGSRYLGYNTLENGLSYLGINAGGDWETPIFFMLYWDGKSIRGYVPKEGNTWNQVTKQAFGNDEKKDIEALKKLGIYSNEGYGHGRDNIKFDFDKMMQEIQHHITYKEKN